MNNMRMWKILGPYLQYNGVEKHQPVPIHQWSNTNLSSKIKLQSTHIHSDSDRCTFIYKPVGCVVQIIDL